ncbi:MAG: hypothetical protein N2491_02815 [Negativicutes bacterium]|nr:hypothetical protein [Negativicutes bacterium]
MWIATGEKILLKLAALLLSVLMIIQLLFIKDTTRHYVSRIDKLEGETVARNSPLYAVQPLTVSEKSEAMAVSPLKSLRESRVIVLRLIRPQTSPYIYATVNGQSVGDFARGDLKFAIYDGDYIEIDANYFDGQAQLIVSVPNSELVAPMDGLVIDVQDRRSVPIGRVKFK